MPLDIELGKNHLQRSVNRGVRDESSGGEGELKCYRQYIQGNKRIREERVGEEGGGGEKKRFEIFHRVKNRVCVYNHSPHSTIATFDYSPKWRQHLLKKKKIKKEKDENPTCKEHFLPPSLLHNGGDKLINKLHPRTFKAERG